MSETSVLLPRLLLATLLLAIAGCRNDAPERPDLVLVTIDALSADRLSCFGGDPRMGGSLCALAKDGTLFAWGAAQGRGEASAAATVLTGLPARVHGVRDDGPTFLRSESVSIAEMLSEVGYRTAAFVATPRLNRSRRLDQGFDRYEDEVAEPGADATRASVSRANRIQRWLDANPSPRFVWIHADRGAGIGEFDRLLSRLSQSLESGEQGAGLLFVALRGEPLPEQPDSIAWSSHRIPLLWRPPNASGETAPRVSRRLVGLADVFPTLRAAARIPEARPTSAEAPESLPSPFAGQNLSVVARPSPTEEPRPERFIFLETASPNGEVGLASDTHLYVRGPSPLDGTGQPVPTGSLTSHRARFAALPIFDRLRHAAPRSGELVPGPWRDDVLDPESPVPRLEFHLARQLAPLSTEESR